MNCTLEELYEKDPDFIFGEYLGDVCYQVHAWNLKDGVALDLPVFDTFEGLVRAVFADLAEEQIKVIAKSEYGKCIVIAAKGLAERGHILPSTINIAEKIVACNEKG